MSGRIVEEVLKYAPADVKGLDLLVLISLAESARERDRTARTDSSADAIAYRVRSTPGSVRHATSRLRQRALIRPLHKVTGPGKAQGWIIAELSEWHRGSVNGHSRDEPDDT